MPRIPIAPHPAVTCAVLLALGPSTLRAQSQLVSAAGTQRGATKCIVVQNASHAGGAAAVLWDCAGGDNEKFTAANSSTSVYGGAMCLDTYPAAGNNNDPVKLWPCHGGGATDSQRWTYTSGGALRNVRTGRCADIQGGNASATTNGRPIVLYDCTGNASQAWTARGAAVTGAPTPGAPAAPATASVAVSAGMAMITDDGRCVYGGGAMGVTSAGQCGMNFGVFKPVYHAANYYSINTTGGQCVTMPAAKGGAVSTQACTDATTQRFYFNTSGQIQQVGAGVCIDVAGGQRSVSYRLIAWDCDFNSNIAARAWNQRFAFGYLAQTPPSLRLDGSFALGSRSYAQAAARGTVVAPTSPDGAARLISQDGSGIVAQGGGNLTGSSGSAVIAIGAANIVAQGGGNIVAQGGGNIVLPSSGIVAQGGGNIIAVGH